MTGRERNAKRVVKASVWAVMVFVICSLVGHKLDYGMIAVAVGAVVVSDILDGMLPTSGSGR